VVAAFEREHQALAVGRIADELQRILDGLRATHIEVHAALAPELALHVLSNGLGELDTSLVEVLAGHLRQHVDLALQRIVQALIAVTEIDRGVPHLQVEERHVRRVVHPAAFTAAEDLRRVHVVHGVAEGAVLGFVAQQLRVVDGGGSAFVEYVHEGSVTQARLSWMAGSVEGSSSVPSSNAGSSASASSKPVIGI